MHFHFIMLSIFKNKDKKKKKMDIILASQSPSRKLLLKQTGISFRIHPSHIDESKIKSLNLSPKAICMKLAKQKAEIVKKKFTNSLIIASDQIAHLDGKIYGKAIKKQKAINHLQDLQGKTHELINALFMTYQEKTFQHISINQMTMRSLDKKQILKYIELDQPFYSAGSYLIDQAGLSLFERIDSKDFSSIIGFPISILINQLIKWGVPYLGKSKTTSV